MKGLVGMIALGTLALVGCWRLALWTARGSVMTLDPDTASGEWKMPHGSCLRGDCLDLRDRLATVEREREGVKRERDEARATAHRFGADSDAFVRVIDALVIERDAAQAELADEKLAHADAERVALEAQAMYEAEMTLRIEARRVTTDPYDVRIEQLEFEVARLAEERRLLIEEAREQAVIAQRLRAALANFWLRTKGLADEMDAALLDAARRREGK